MTAIRWIFFDLGSTLIDETDADARRIDEMTAGTKVAPDEYRRKRLEFIRQGQGGDLAAIAFFGLTKTPWPSEEERPWPDAAPTLAELRRLGFRLGVIANQNPGTERRLAAWDLLRYFDVVAPSAELGVAKPDPAIFRWALDRAGCESSEALMVGDRLDNDVAPAKALGMHTVRLLRGVGAYHRPQSSAEEPEHTIRALSELPELLGQIPQGRRADLKERDISYISGREKFNYRVCAVIIREGRILAMHDERSPYYYLPGGRVRLGETAEDAVCREVEEELRIRAVILRPLWLNQSFFTEDVDGLRYHELCLYFLMDVSKTDLPERGARFTLREGRHTHEFEWLAFNRLQEEYFYPTFLKTEIFHLPEQFTLRTELE